MTITADSIEQYFARLRVILAVRTLAIHSVPRQAIIDSCSTNSCFRVLCLQVPAQFIEQYFARSLENWGVSVADKVWISCSILVQAIVDTGLTDTLIFEDRLPAITRFLVDSCSLTSFIPGSRQAPTRAVADTRSVTLSLPGPVFQVLRD